MNTTQQTFAAPLTFNEFIIWRRLGTRRFFGPFVISVDAPGTDPPSLPVPTAERLASLLPDFEEDFEALIAVFELDKPPCVVQMDIGTITMSTVQVDFRQLLWILPTTERARTMLERRVLPPVRLGNPVLETQILDKDKEQRRLKAIRGAQALISLARLDDRIHAYDMCSPTVHQWLERHERSQTPVSAEGTLLTRCMSYKRQKPYDKSNGDLQFMQDLASIVAQMPLPGGDASNLQEALLNAIGPFLIEAQAKRQHCSLRKCVEAFLPFHNEHRELFDIHPLSGMVFLKLLQEDGEADRKWSDVVAQIRADFPDLLDEVAVGLGVAGAFLGFPKLAEDSYEMTHRRRLQESPPDQHGRLTPDAKWRGSRSRRLAKTSLNPTPPRKGHSNSGNDAGARRAKEGSDEPPSTTPGSTSQSAVPPNPPPNNETPSAEATEQSPAQPPTGSAPPQHEEPSNPST